MIQIEEFLENARQHGSKVDPRGNNEWMVSCPCHEDDTPSMSVAVKQGGKILLHCHGCEAKYEEIITAFGYKKEDFRPEKPENRKNLIYPYVDENGAELFQVVKYYRKKDGKKMFYQRRHIDGVKGWVNALRGGKYKQDSKNGEWYLSDNEKRWEYRTAVPRSEQTLPKHDKYVLYRLPEIIDAPRLVIVEGEKDVDNLWELGVPATTNMGGVKKFKPEYIEPMKNKACIYTIPDNDRKEHQGVKHMKKVAEMCCDAGITVRSLPPFEGNKDHYDISDWLENGGTRRKLNRILDNTPVFEPGTKTLEPVDNGNGKPKIENIPIEQENALALYDKHREELRHEVDRNYWYQWNEIEWEKIPDTKVLSLLIGLAEDHKKEMFEAINSGEMGTDKEKRLRRLAIDSLKSRNIKNAFGNAKLIPEFWTYERDYDVDIDLFNVNNGVIDTRTGELLPHDKSRDISKHSDIEYDPAATCPVFIEFLETVFNWNQDLIGFLQRATGYSLTGSVKEQCFFILYGTGANGKSTFLNIISELIGHYALKAQSELLLTKKPGGISNDVASLRYARFVTATETGEGRRLNEGLVKDLTGEQTITARFLYQEQFEFHPQFKLWLATNSKPVIKGTNNAIWRRIRLIPFEKVIEKENQDPDLIEKLRQELPGILNWAIRGCREWRENRLNEPEEVIAATEEYKNEMDTIGKFFKECLEFDNELFQVYAKDIKTEMEKWCDENGAKPLWLNKVSKELKNRGCKKDHSKAGNYWSGVKIKE